MMGYSLIATILIILGIYYVIPYVARNMLRSRFLASIKQNDSVCLTFDDGPNPESTREILALLNQLGVKATFFLIGRNIEKHSDLYYEIINNGHEVGNHGYRHIHVWICFPFYGVVDLIRGNSILKKYYSSDQLLWLRPPYGKLNILTLLYVLLCRRKIAFWNIDPRDYVAQQPCQICSKVLENVSGGSVILLHEHSFRTRKELKGNLDAIKMIVQELKKKGYAFVKISEAVLAEKQMKKIQIEE